MQLTKNFTRQEFACNGANCCNHSSPINPRLVCALQVLRDCAGVPLHITSGFRCNKHNKVVGGANNSQHVYGIAADIRTPKGFAPRTLFVLAETTGLFDGIGVYDWGIHVDLRSIKARWDYRTKK